MNNQAAQSVRGKRFAIFIVLAVFGVGIGLAAVAIWVATTGGTPPPPGAAP